MQKYTKDDAAIGIEDLECWPANSYTVNFHSQTVSASSVTELAKVSEFLVSACMIDNNSTRLLASVGIKMSCGGYGIWPRFQRVAASSIMSKSGTQL